MSKRSVFIRRFIIFLLGMSFMALSISLSAKASLGMMPSNTLAYVISKLTDIQLGNCVTIVLLAYVLLQFAVLGLERKFEPLRILQMVAAVLSGRLVNLFSAMIAGWNLYNYLLKLLVFAFSIVFYGFGAVFCVRANMILSPTEGLLLVLMQGPLKNKKMTLGRMRILNDLLVLAVSLSISLIVLGGITGVREGTALSALLVGTSIDIVGKIFNKPVEKFMYGEKKQDKEAKTDEQKSVS